MSIVFFGEALYDLYSDVPPVDPVDPSVLRANIGGGVLNAAVGAKRWLRHRVHSTLPVYFIGGISTDGFGEKILHLLHQEHIDTTRCVRSDAVSALAIVFNDSQGERSFSFYRHRTADLHYPTDCWRMEWFKGATIFACDTNCMTTKEIFSSNMAALEYARSTKTTVALDVNLRPSLWECREDMRARVHEALSYATIIKFSAEELPLIFDAADESAQRKQLFALPAHAKVPRILCVSRGKEGCSIYFEDSTIGSAIHISAPAVTAIDTTGAGDAFFGTLCAFLALHPLNSTHFSGHTPAHADNSTHNNTGTPNHAGTHNHTADHTRAATEEHAPQMAFGGGEGAAHNHTTDPKTTGTVPYPAHTGTTAKERTRNIRPAHPAHALLHRAATEAVAFAAHTVQYQGALRYPIAQQDDARTSA